MTMKEKIIEVLNGERLTIKDITNKINKKYQINTTEARIRMYVWRLKDEDKDNAIEECGKDNRYKVYKLKSNVYDENSELTDKLVLLMIKAGINSDNYGIEIKENEIESIINRLQESDQIG